MKKLFMLLACLLLLSLEACGTGTKKGGEEAPSRVLPAAEESAEETGAAEEGLTRSGMPGEEQPWGEGVPADQELDLSGLQREEVFREIERMNTDPRGYAGLRLKVIGEVSRFESHDRILYYVGARDEDGCVENLELRFPGDGSVPADFPEDGGIISVWGRIETYEVQQGGEGKLCPVLTEAEFIPLPDYRD